MAKLSLQPGINREPWRALLDGLEAELPGGAAGPDRGRLLVVDLDRVDASALRSIARGMDLSDAEVAGLGEARLRAPIESAPLRKRKAGAAWAIRQAPIAAGHDDALIVKWFETEPKGRPHTLRVRLVFRTLGPNTLTDGARALAIARQWKAKRTHIDGVSLMVESHGTSPRLGAALRMGRVVTLRPFVPGAVETASNVPAIAAATHGAMVVTLHPGAAR